MSSVVAAVVTLASDALVALNLLAEGVLAAGEDQTHCSEKLSPEKTGILLAVLALRRVVDVGDEEAMR
ncbi:hypothetical protein NUW58_g8740 [Xylaria curta]|uniref:Uncharacterized protein n=1 Tax=Xylaria curta TaxID=42375 RepID=A0ACC1N4I3_9PEZI|nr:hypothetical protein NUW58_g8740 [Xylaria curta]